MKILLLLNLLIEGLVGLAFLIAPESIPSFDGGPQTLYMVRMYGIGAMAMALLSARAWILFHEQVLLENALLVLACFHSGVALVQFLNSLAWADVSGPLILHTLFALTFWVFYFREA